MMDFDELAKKYGGQPVAGTSKYDELAKRFGGRLVEAAPAQEPPKEGGFFSNIGKLALEGGERAIGAAKVSPSVISGDVGKDQAALISEQLSMKPTVQPKELTEVTTAFKDEAEALKKAKGFTESVGPTLQFMAEFGKQALTNPRGIAYLTAQSAANMAPSIAGMIVGGKTGAMAGTAVAPGPGTAIGGVSGAVLGGFAGSAPMEIGAEFIDNVGKELRARNMEPTQENVEALLSDRAFVQKAVGEARTKGTTTAAVDAALTAGAGRYATGPRRAAIKAAQTELGVAADAATVAKRAEEILKQGTRAERAGRAVKRGAGAVGIDVAGGGLSEAAGQYAAYGEIDPESVALEMLGELGGSAIEVPSAAYATSRDMLRAKARKDAADIIQKERAITGEEPPRTQPAQAPAEVSDIEELERQFGMAAPSAEAEAAVAETTEPAAPPAVPPIIAKEEPAAEPAAAEVQAKTEVSPENETPQQRLDRLRGKRIGMMNAFRDNVITNREYEAFQADLAAAEEQAKGAPTDVSQLSEAKQEVLRMADEIEAAGNKSFADGMRLNAKPESREPTAQTMEFYRSKLPQKPKAEEAGAAAEQVTYGLPEFFSSTPKDADRIAGLRKSGPPKVRMALDEINDTMQTLMDTITNAGYKMENVIPGQVPPAILRIKSQIGLLASDASRIARSAEAIQKGYKRADKKRLDADIKGALDGINEAEDLIAFDRNVPTAAEQMEGVAVPPSPEVQDLMDEQKKAAQDIARLKNRGQSLWTALAGKLSKEEVRGLGGRTMQVGKNQFLNLGAKRGKPATELADLVADGVLDPFLPPNMRHDAAQFDNTESTEYIRNKLASGQYTTHDTDVAIEQIGQEALELERRIQEELSLEEINREIQLANDEQREADQAAADFAAEGEAGAAAQRQAEEATELDDLEKRAADAGIDVDAIREEVYYDTRGEEDVNYERTLADRLRGALSVQEQFLAMQTEEELKAKQELEAQKEKTRKGEEKAKEEKAKADEAAADFVLTGSDREADEAAARGQSSMFSAEKGQTGYSPDPEDQRIEKELTGKTMLQAADWAVQNAPNAFAKVIAEKVRNRLRELQRKGVELEFKVEGGNTRSARMSGARGLTISNWGEKELGTKTKFSVTLNGAAVLQNQAGYPPGTRYATLLHELIHVATMGQLQFTPFSDPIRKQLRELSNAIVARFNEDAKAGKLPPVMQKYYKRENNVLRDDDEVMAWGLTDGEVQKYYADIKVGEKSAMSKLVDLVRQILGLGKPYESALDRLVTVSESLLDADIDTIEAVLGKSGRTLGEAKAAPAKGEQQALFQKEIESMTSGWSDSRIGQLIKQYGYPGGKTKAYAAYVHPDEFVNATTPTSERKQEIEEEAGPLDLKKIKAETQTPFLYINQINKGTPQEEWEIVGHEGRHRMAALNAAGIQRAPVVLVMQENGFASPDKYEPIAQAVQVAGQSFDTGTGLDIDVFGMVPISSEYEGQLSSDFGKGDIRYQQEGGAPKGRQNILGKPVLPAGSMPPGEGYELANWTLQPDPKLESKDSVIYKLQDKSIDLKRAVAEIRKSVSDLATRWNPYMQEELYHGRTAYEDKMFKLNELSPLIKEMEETGVTIGELEQYLQNRHAEAYNRHVAKVNPNKADMQDGGSGIKTEDARDYLDSLPEEKRKVYEKLAKRVDSITKGTRELLVKSGLEKRETIDNWEKTFPDYVPLMREEDDFEYTTSSFGVGRGYDVRGPSSKAAMGSKKKVVDILANVALARERAIVRAEKNRVAQALYGLALQAPNPNFWLAINPTAEKIPDSAIEELQGMGLDEGLIKFLMKEPRQRALDPKRNEVVERINTALRNNKNVLSTRINGENRYVFFNPNNDRAKRAAIALKNLDAQDLGFLLGIMSKVTRFIASMNTQYNPIFGAYNFLRDVQGATLQLSTTPLAGKQKQVMSNVMPAMGAIFQSLRKEGKGEKVDTEMGRLWEDFQKAGGQTGFRDMYSRSQDRAKAIISEFEKIKQGKLRKGFGATFKLLSDYNDTMENAVRLAAYKVALDEGKNKDEAASIAKNLTVNFNRKGDIAVQAGALYAFFNAAMQSTARLYETLRGPLGKKIIAGGLLWGVIQSSLLAMAGFDEEEPPEFVRERNFIIPTGWLTGKDDYVAFPMPLGYHVIPGFSRQITDAVFAAAGVIKSNKTPVERVAEMTGMFLEAFNPIGNAGWSLQTIMPTPFDPFVALGENRDWTGKKIYREDINELRPTPGYTRAKDSANFVSTKLAEYINLASGGTKYQKGLISPTPEHLEFLLGQALGGVGREGLKFAQTIEKTYTGEELPPYKIPLVGRFYGETKSSAAEANRFYKNLERLNSLKAEIEGRKENREPLGDFMQQNPEARLAKRANEVYSDIKKLRERREKLVERDAPRESVKAVETQITNKMRMLNEQVDRLKK
jgi:hypothetical protein